MADVKNSLTAADAGMDAQHKPARKAPAFGPKSAFAKVNRWQRLAIQVVFLIFAPQTFSLAFAGVKQLFVALGELETFEANTFLILLLLLVALTVVFGRFFCGYLCAFGTIGDILYKVVDFPLKKLHVKRPALPDKVENVLRCLKYVVLAFFLVTSAIGLSGTISVYSPWTAFGRLLALNIEDLNVIGLGLLVIIAIGMICKERFFCEFLCPMGAVFSLLPILPFGNHRRDASVCDSCGACKRNCPVNIVPPAEGAQMGECLACGRCETVCPHGCIGQCSPDQLEKRLLAGAEGQDIPQESPAKRAHTVRVVIVAIVMFALFWLLGAVNFLPTLG